MEAQLGTTNLLLGIMAAVSLLEAAAVIGLFLGGFLLYRRFSKVIEGIEERQVAPAAARLNAILDDIKDATSTVKDEVGRIGSISRRITDILRGRSQSPPPAS